MKKSNLELFKESLREFIKNTPREEILKMLEIEDPKEPTYSDFLVPRELALNLKDTGFDLPCMFNFFESKTYFMRLVNKNLSMEDIRPSFNNKFDCVVPSYDQVMKWFRDKGYDVNIDYVFSEDLNAAIGYSYDIIFENKFLKMDQYFETYEIARDEAIKEIIEHLKRNHENSI